MGRGRDWVGDYLEDIAGSNNNGDGKIGRIPSKFLDLPHFLTCHTSRSPFLEQQEVVVQIIISSIVVAFQAMSSPRRWQKKGGCGILARNDNIVPSKKCDEDYAANLVTRCQNHHRVGLSPSLARRRLTRG